MKNIDKMIYQSISHKNKNCKTAIVNVKNGKTNSQIAYFPLNIAFVDGKLKKVLKHQPELFAQVQVYNNAKVLTDIANIVCNKINSCTMFYRGTRGLAFVEYIAKDAAKAITSWQYIKAEDYINMRYGFCNLYKKELQILPYLIINNLFLNIVDFCEHLDELQCDMLKGARARRLPKLNKLSDAMVYGFAKYNPNLLNLSQISSSHIKRCVFYFISQLNKIDDKLSICINNILNVFNKYCKGKELKRV